MLNFLTQTCTHKRNTTGSSLGTIASGIACSPPDGVSRVYAQDYPMEKLFLLRQVFTKYTAFAAGDYLVHGTDTYAVKAVHPWESQGSLDDYYQLIIEYQSGS